MALPGGPVMKVAVTGSEKPLVSSGDEHGLDGQHEADHDVPPAQPVETTLGVAVGGNGAPSASAAF